VGLFVVSWYYVPIHLSGWFWVLNINLYGLLTIRELINLGRDQQKDKLGNYYGVISDWLVYLTMLVYMLPRTVFTKAILTTSGYPKSEYLLLHAALFEYKIILVLILSGIILIIFCSTLKRGALRY
jgi:hypothetical protein